MCSNNNHQLYSSILAKFGIIFQSYKPHQAYKNNLQLFIISVFFSILFFYVILEFLRQLSKKEA